MTPSNRELFETGYSWRQLDEVGRTRYDRRVHELRTNLVRTYARGSVLDLCCGTGLHLPTAIDSGTEVIGVDLSRHMLEGVRTKPFAAKVPLVQADARVLPLRTASFDAAFSFASLYTVPAVDRVADELRRVLRPGGHAVIELGNRRSLNVLVTRAHHRESGWAEPHYISLRQIRAFADEIGEVVRWESFQVLPMLRTTRSRRALAPLAHPGWKLVLAPRLRGRMLDQWLSSAPGWRAVAFRHMLVIRR